ncbi:MAG: methyltransferase domain-containing protein [Candidatus Gottesmanbacteria bacterium]
MSDYLDETIDIYNSVASTYAKQMLDHGPVMQRKHFASLLPRSGKILDAGCAAGRDSAYFAEHGFKVTGIDISEKLLELARVVVPGAKFYSADIRHLSFEKAMFDGIWACASIHHIKHNELPKVFTEFFAILKPGGMLYVHVKKGEGEEYLDEPSIPGRKRFYSLFSKEKLKKYCEDAGFTVLEVFDVASKEVYAEGKISRVWVACFAKKV